MARIRTVKPDFWQHPKVCGVSRDARLLFLGLLNEADDEGRMRYSGKRLAGVLFAEDEDVDGAWIDNRVVELQEAGLVCRYTVAEAHLLEVCGFAEHQKINRPTPSRLPSLTNHGFPVNPHGGLTEDSPGEREQGTGNKEVEQGTGSAPARARDPWFDGFIAAWKIESRELTDVERDRVGVAASKLRAINADPSEIPSRRAMYALLFPHAAQTMMALANRWAECRPDPDRLPVAASENAGAITRAIARAR